MLWRLRSDPHGAADVIAALASGVVPVLIPDRTTPDKIATLRHKLPRFDYFDGTHMHEAAEPVTADDRPFVGILTSGSTGEPKILIADEPSLVAGIRAINDAQRLDDVDSTGILLPLAYSFAFVNQLLWAILYERRITFLAGFRDPAGSIALLAEAGIEMICLVDLPPWTGPVGMLVQ